MIYNLLERSLTNLSSKLSTTTNAFGNEVIIEDKIKFSSYTVNFDCNSFYFTYCNIKLYIVNILCDFKSVLPNCYPINEQYVKFKVSDNYQQHNRG